MAWLTWISRCSSDVCFGVSRSDLVFLTEAESFLELLGLLQLCSDYPPADAAPDAGPQGGGCRRVISLVHQAADRRLHVHRHDRFWVVIIWEACV